MREAVKATVDAVSAESGAELVPVLAARAEAAQALAQSTYPGARPMRATVTDAEGWHAGSAFADQAELHRRAKLARGAYGYTKSVR